MLNMLTELIFSGHNSQITRRKNVGEYGFVIFCNFVLFFVGNLFLNLFSFPYIFFKLHLFSFDSPISDVQM